MSDIISLTKRHSAFRTARKLRQQSFFMACKDHEQALTAVRAKRVMLQALDVRLHDVENAVKACRSQQGAMNVSMLMYWSEVRRALSVQRSELLTVVHELESVAAEKRSEMLKQKLQLEKICDEEHYAQRMVRTIAEDTASALAVDDLFGRDSWRMA